jgi:hypothetical protein
MAASKREKQSASDGQSLTHSMFASRLISWFCLTHQCSGANDMTVLESGRPDAACSAVFSCRRKKWHFLILDEAHYIKK